MKQEILLNGKMSKSSSNVQNNLALDIDSDSRALPIENIDAKLNEYKQYEKEKMNSNKYRLSFIINPICSNVLFNNISEIVYKEGSDDCVAFGENQIFGTSGETGSTYSFLEKNTGVTAYKNYKGNGFTSHEDFSTMKDKPISASTETITKELSGLSRYDLIRDTSFSHVDIGGVVYHCGYDIFNNHILRQKEFSTVNKLSSGNGEKSTFNTIDDYSRDYWGNTVKEYVNNFNGSFTGGTKETKGKIILSKGDLLKPHQGKMHLYLNDTVYSFEESINENLTEKDGWYGFINKTNLDVRNYIEISLNKVMNNNKSCEFIDMYPDRSLFSFIPKVNKYRNNRLEKNWNYCLTYPWKNFDDNELVTRKISENEKINGLECELANPSILNDNNEEIYVILKTKIRNNFSINSIVDIVLIIGDKDNKTVVKLPDTEKIINVGLNGKNKNYYFTIYKEQLVDYILSTDPTITEGDFEKKVEIRVRQVINGGVCKYYFRKFRRIPNFKNTDAYIDGIIDENELKSGSSKDFNSTISKSAFSENIYSDRIAQILYNDDVDLSYLTDNLGRKVSEIFLTIVKTNKGWDKWYNLKEVTNEDIEYSHCFGKVSSGIDLKFNYKEDFKEDGDNNFYYYNDYNIHRINELDGDTVPLDNEFQKCFKLFVWRQEEISFNVGTSEYLDEILSDRGNKDKYILIIQDFGEITVKKYHSGEIYRLIEPFTIGGKLMPIQISELPITREFKENNKLEEDLSIAGDNENSFLGDIVEFSPLTLNEIVLEDVLHRFNTAQRECSIDDEFKDIWKDVILYDDFDIEGHGFEVVKESYNAIYNITAQTDNLKIDKIKEFPANLAPEGYYYKPHYRVLLKLYNSKIYEGQHTKINIENAEYDSKNETWTINTDKNYYPEKGKEIWIYNKKNQSKTIALITEVNKEKLFKEFKFKRIGGDVLNNENDEYFNENYVLYKPNVEKPANAYDLDDGTGRYLWREFMTDAEENNTELRGYTFTNGAHYINKQINFFLRRQDPVGKFGLNNVARGNALISKLVIGGNEVDYDNIEYIDTEEEPNRIC